MPAKTTTPDSGELTQRFVQAVNRRDVEAVMGFFAPDAVWEALAAGDERLRGRSAIRQMVEDMLRPYEKYEVEVEELRDLGGGISFSVSEHTGRLVGGSGVVQMRLGIVMRREGGLIAHIAAYLDIDEARADAERLAEERG